MNKNLHLKSRSTNISIPSTHTNLPRLFFLSLNLFIPKVKKYGGINMKFKEYPYP